MLLLLATLTFAAGARDRPRMTSPLQQSVVRTNSVRVSVTVGQPDSVRQVLFYCEMLEPNRDGSETTRFATDSTAPYEVIWLGDNALDQSFPDLSFFADVVLHDGTLERTDTVSVALDREERRSLVTASARRQDERVTIDGFLNPSEGWPDTASLTVELDNNRYEVSLGYTDDGLLIAVRAFDNAVTTSFVPDSTRELGWRTHPWPTSDSLVHKVWRDDCVAFFIDADLSRESIVQPDDCLLYLAPSGAILAVREDYRRAMVTNCAPAIEWAAVPSPEGYTGECLVPWRVLGMERVADHPLGFEVYVVDRDNPDGERLIGSWSSAPHNHLNPSEWGTVHLVPDNGLHWATVAAVALVAALLLTGTGWLYLRTRRTPQAATATTTMSATVAKAVAFIDGHAAEPDLNRDRIAAHLKISGNYLGKLFKHETGKSIPAYLNDLRTARAAELLRDTDQQVTQVALEVGFASADHFIRTFRARYGTTPARYRKDRGAA
ncbi:MAG: helix-turn-helix domain-containing protein [Chitinivibrionales bacterium]|nr:helix-turn-helix domain-containing protein [Chitinivibrionales bacterium]